MSVSLKRNLGKLHFLRSSYYFWIAWRERLRWAGENNVREWLNTLYENPDPWNYTTSSDEFERFASASNMLDQVRGPKRFQRTFEVGCAEGVFTRMLAERSDSVLAVDLSDFALNRARQRCVELPVRFETWDLRNSPPPREMDLVVIMDVLEMFFRPREIKDAREKLVSAVRPGGYLLLGNTRENPIFETSWWGKWMLRGGKNIADFFSQHPRLERLSLQSGEIYVNALFRAH